MIFTWPMRVHTLWMTIFNAFILQLSMIRVHPKPFSLHLKIHFVPLCWPSTALQNFQGSQLSSVEWRGFLQKFRFLALSREILLRFHSSHTKKVNSIFPFFYGALWNVWIHVCILVWFHLHFEFHFYVSWHCWNLWFPFRSTLGMPKAPYMSCELGYNGFICLKC